MIIRKSAFGGLLASVSLVALLGLPAQAAPAVPASSAALMAAASSAKVTGSDLLKKAQKALAVALTSVKGLSADKLSTSAPYLKAISEADKALLAIKDAIASKDNAKLGKAVSEGAKAVGRLNSTYKKANIDDPKVKEGMRAFNKAWDKTLKRLGGAKPGTPQQAQDNGRRIAALNRQIADLKAKQAEQDAQDELAYLLDQLARAQELNRNPDYQWLALLALDEALGYYGGYYDYLAAYDPDLAVSWLEPYNYWNGLYDDWSPYYAGYYDGYNYGAYDAALDYPSQDEINAAIVDATAQAAADATIDAIAANAEAAAAAAPGGEALEASRAALADAPPPPVPDPAETADAEADSVSSQPLDAAEAEKAAEAELADDAVGEEPADAPEEAAPADEPTEEPAAEPDEQTEEPAAEPEGQNEEPAAEPEEQHEEPAAEEGDADHDGIPDDQDPDDNNDGTPDEDGH